MGLFGKIKDVAEDAGDKIKDVADDVGDFVKDDVGDAAKDAAKKTKRGLKKTGKELLNTAQKTGDFFKDDIGGFFSDVGGFITDDIGGFFSDLWNGYGSDDANASMDWLMYLILGIFGVGALIFIIILIRRNSQS